MLNVLNEADEPYSNGTVRCNQDAECARKGSEEVVTKSPNDDQKTNASGEGDDMMSLATDSLFGKRLSDSSGKLAVEPRTTSLIDSQDRRSSLSMCITKGKDERTF